MKYVLYTTSMSNVNRKNGKFFSSCRTNFKSLEEAKVKFDRYINEPVFDNVAIRLVAIDENKVKTTMAERI